MVVVVGGGTLMLALLQWAFTGGPGLLFGLGFWAAAIFGAVRARPSVLPLAVVMPPLAFAGAVLVATMLFPTGNSGGFVRGTVVEWFTVLAFKAGLLWSGTLFAAVIAFTRHRSARAARRR